MKLFAASQAVKAPGRNTCGGMCTRTTRQHGGC